MVRIIIILVGLTKLLLQFKFLSAEKQNMSKHLYWSSEHAFSYVFKMKTQILDDM